MHPFQTQCEQCTGVCNVMLTLQQIHLQKHTHTHQQKHPNNNKSSHTALTLAVHTLFTPVTHQKTPPNRPQLTISTTGLVDTGGSVSVRSVNGAEDAVAIVEQCGRVNRPY